MNGQSVMRHYSGFWIPVVDHSTLELLKDGRSSLVYIPNRVAIVFLFSATVLLTTSPASAVSWTLEATFETKSFAGLAIDGGRLLIADDLYDANSGQLLRTYDDLTSGPDGSKSFGDAVALYGERAVIGADRDEGSGRVFLFDAGTGTLLHTFDDPTPTFQDGFGTSVAVDENYIVVGAPHDDTQQPNLGQVHLFSTKTGNLLRTFDDPTLHNRTGDAFGFSVAIDGHNVLIGSPFDNTSGQDSGQAHLFDANTGRLLQTFDTPNPQSYGFDLFGYSVSMDGSNVLIGARGQSLAYLFDAVTGDLLQTFDDPTSETRDDFGHSVAIDGNYVLIGAPIDSTHGTSVGQAHLFDAVTGNLLHTFDNPNSTVRGFFGWPVAIDGMNVLIKERGAAHLFTIPEPATFILTALGGIWMTRRHITRQST